MVNTLDIDVSTLHTPAATRLLTHQSDALGKIGNVPIVGDETYTSESLAGSVVGLLAGRVFSNSSMASALRSVRPMSSRPSSRRQRVESSVWNLGEMEPHSIKRFSKSTVTSAP